MAIFIAGVTTGWTSNAVAADAALRESPASNNTQTKPSGFIKTSLNTSRRFRQNQFSADHVLVEKTKRRLTLFSDGQVLKRYKISLGREPVGAKVRSGDNRTPEGLYYIDYRIQDSDYHMALHISYPNEVDTRRARQMGYSPGGSIMLHGLKNNDKEIAYYHGYFDWTKGCIAVTNTEIEEIWQLVPNGTSIEIRP
jgi:murein L,D-transpeptidase YafK